MSDRRWRYEDDWSTDEDDLDGGDLADRRRAGPPDDARSDPRRRLGERELGEHAGGDELQVLSLLHTLAESIKAREGEWSGMSLATAWSLDVPASRPPRTVAGLSADESETVEEWPDHIGKYRVIGEPLGAGRRGSSFAWNIQICEPPASSSWPGTRSRRARRDATAWSARAGRWIHVSTPTWSACSISIISTDVPSSSWKMSKA